MTVSVYFLWCSRHIFNYFKEQYDNFFDDNIAKSIKKKKKEKEKELEKEEEMENDKEEKEEKSKAVPKGKKP